jgi:hypothetical protein
MDPDAFEAINKPIASSLKDQSESHLEKRSDARIEQLIGLNKTPVGLLLRCRIDTGVLGSPAGVLFSCCGLVTSNLGFCQRSGAAAACGMASPRAG